MWIATFHDVAVEAPPAAPDKSIVDSRVNALISLMGSYDKLLAAEL